MADTVPAVEEAARFTYTLDVPLAKSGAVGGAEARFSCCHRTAAQGHAGHCHLGNREQTIRTALERAGFDITAPGTLTPGGEDTAEEDRAWLAEFLNHAPDIDPHDDEAGIVDLIAPYARLLRICVDERDRRAAPPRPLTDSTMKYDVQFTTREANAPLIALVQANVGRAPDSSTVTGGERVLAWSCNDMAEAEQIEARVKGALHYTIGVQTAPDVTSGGLPGGATSMNPTP